MQQSAVRRLHTDDSGMTVVEVVVASFILFFVLTAVLGLVGATTQTSVSAKQRTAMTNAVSSYIEHVRSLPFNRVALSTDNPPGDVEPSIIKAEGAFTITLIVDAMPDERNPLSTKAILLDTLPGVRAMKAEETRQRIVGMRDQKVLPTNIKYHLDHLTVVQDDFGDVIRIGDGDEVSTVLHPACANVARYHAGERAMKPCLSPSGASADVNSSRNAMPSSISTMPRRPRLSSGVRT